MTNEHTPRWMTRYNDCVKSKQPLFAVWNGWVESPIGGTFASFCVSLFRFTFNLHTILESVSPSKMLLMTRRANFARRMMLLKLVGMLEPIVVSVLDSIQIRLSCQQNLTSSLWIDPNYIIIKIIQMIIKGSNDREENWRADKKSRTDEPSAFNAIGYFKTKFVEWNARWNFKRKRKCSLFPLKRNLFNAMNHWIGWD